MLEAKDVSFEVLPFFSFDRAAHVWSLSWWSLIRTLQISVATFVGLLGHAVSRVFEVIVGDRGRGRSVKPPKAWGNDQKRRPQPNAGR